MAASQTVVITMECQDCHERNYTTTKNRRTKSEKLQLKKYCARCHGHRAHKETK